MCKEKWIGNWKNTLTVLTFHRVALGFKCKIEALHEGSLIKIQVLEQLNYNLRVKKIKYFKNCRKILLSNMVIKCHTQVNEKSSNGVLYSMNRWPISN